MNYLYIIPIPQESIFKIGITTNLEERLNAHQTKWRRELGIFDRSSVKYIKSSSAGKIATLENDLKYKYEAHNTGHDVAGYTEIYNISCMDQVIQEVNRSAEMYGIDALGEYTVKAKTYKRTPYPSKEERERRRKERMQAEKTNQERENQNAITSLVKAYNELKNDFELIESPQHIALKFSEVDNRDIFDRSPFSVWIRFPDLVVEQEGSISLNGDVISNYYEDKKELKIYFRKDKLNLLGKYRPDLFDQLPNELKRIPIHPN